MFITILCKVVDNFGDIGVTFRMAKNLKKINPENTVNLIVDDLNSFNKISDSVDSSKDFQLVNDICVYNWNSFEYCYNHFKENDGEELSVILECFQCGRPDWMEKLLFDDKLNRTVNIIMIDYLTAEKYAEDFHCLQSLTRSSKVKKINFMPGFTDKTGGLIIDNQWQKLPEYNKDGPLLVFTYEKNWDALIKALNRLELNTKKVLVAGGRGQSSFIDSCLNVKNNFELEKLSYMNLEDWDELVKSCSFLIIRGEESMSRSCLSGIPFIWHAYPQSDEYQLVKVNALLERIKEYFLPEDFEIVKNAWTVINQDDADPLLMENSFFEFLKNYLKLQKGFQKFACDLRKNGDLCCNLMTLIEKISIM